MITINPLKRPDEVNAILFHECPVIESPEDPEVLFAEMKDEIVRITFHPAY
jgi:hypothetical protein